LSILICPKCDTTEKVATHKGTKYNHNVDNGGGWGRVRIYGNCPHCNYMYAVEFHHYDINNQSDLEMAKYYINGDRYKEIVKEMEQSKGKVFMKELNKLLGKYDSKHDLKLKYKAWDTKYEEWIEDFVVLPTGEVMIGDDHCGACSQEKYSIPEYEVNLVIDEGADNQ